jgi:hypothetical protein
MKKFSTAVLLISFNRPDVTRRVLNRILEINPPVLYFFNDAPRPGNESDVEMCSQIRKMASELEFGGVLKTRFEESNLGCKRGVSSATSWLFENEEMGIIIEDDTLPSIDFFWYCQEMLEKYKEDPRVFSITGCNLMNEWKSDLQDYHFALFGSFWGWAGWKRVWELYDLEMSKWKESDIQKLIKNYLPTQHYRDLRRIEFDSLTEGKNNTWDYQLCFLHYLNHAMSVVPSVNLIVNIGLNRNDAVHTTGESVFSDLKHHPVNRPFRHNPVMIPDMEYDDLVIRKAYPWLIEPSPTLPAQPTPPKNLLHKILDRIR